MEIERYAEVRLAEWLCEAIEDTIKRYQFVIEDEEKSLIEDEADAVKEKRKQSDPVFGRYANPEMYEGFATQKREHLTGDKQAIDQLLTLLKLAREFRQQVAEFWEGQNKGK